jgi:hypothetical protein
LFTLLLNCALLAKLIDSTIHTTMTQLKAQIAALSGEVAALKETYDSETVEAHAQPDTGTDELKEQLRKANEVNSGVSLTFYGV